MGGNRERKTAPNGVLLVSGVRRSEARTRANTGKNGRKKNQPRTVGFLESGGGGGNRTRVQNASRLPELQPCTQHGVAGFGYQGSVQLKSGRRPDGVAVNALVSEQSGLEQGEPVAL